MVRITIAVHQRDIWAISEFVEDREQSLFVNPTVMVQRKFVFAAEARRWYAGEASVSG